MNLSPAWVMTPSPFLSTYCCPPAALLEEGVRALPGGVPAGINPSVLYTIKEPIGYPTAAMEGRELSGMI
ncbi:hypothetical protein D3C86_1802890 [compost metagenome]